MSDKKELNPSPKFPSGDYPELSPNPNQREGLVNKTDEKPNSRVVTPLQHQQPTDLTVSQIIELILKYGGDKSKPSFTVNNIKALTDEQCDLLEVGNSVAKKTGNQYHCYIVTFKQDKGGLCLSYFDASCIETQSYDFIEGHWVYNSEDKTDFADLGGLPEVTTDDNGKVLGVESGAWSKMSLNGKYVKVYTQAEYSALTPNQLKDACISGFFMNGELASLINPIVYPAFLHPNGSVYGVIEGATSGGSIVKKRFYLLSGTKQLNGWGDIESIPTGENLRNIQLFNIGKINNKNIPDYPANSAIGQLICRKGTLEYYIPVAVTGITSGDDLAGVQDNLVNAMKDHLDVEINGFRARYQYEENGYVVYSSMAEADSGVNLQVNMISLLIDSPNTISFNQMKFAPVS